MFPNPETGGLWDFVWWMIGSMSCLGVIYMLYMAFGSKGQDGP
jgi:hypothetical protein